MSIKRNIFGALLLASLALSALPAGAVSYDGWWYAYRYNSGGTSYAVMRPHASHFCYLSNVKVVETDTGGESAECRVRRSGTVWLLEAIMGTSSDADVYCGAVCYRN